ncbi:HesA/MoeB/ThiF family protein [Oceanithermus sp.]
MGERYARQLLLKEVGPAGQERLAAASVLVIGAGGLGSPVLLYLAAAGVGRIGIVDDDVVEMSNLNRQILYTVGDVGQPKARVAAGRLREINPDVATVAYERRFAGPEAVELVRAYDVLLDASDNFPTRNLANEAAVAAGRPLVHGSVRQFEGQAAVFNYRQGPCYRCLFPSTPAQAGEADRAIIGPVAGLIGAVMANEAIKIILGAGEVLSGRLLLYDALAMEFRILKVQKNPSCPVCSGRG